MKLIIGKEYYVHQKYAVLEAIEGSYAVMRDRYHNRFECEKTDVQEKPTPYRQLDAKERLKGRSENYWQMSSESQWAEDKRLGILDWDGN